jgi:hypothetical protein
MSRVVIFGGVECERNRTFANEFGVVVDRCGLTMDENLLRLLRFPIA